MTKPEDEALKMIRVIRQELADWFDGMERRLDVIEKRLEKIASEYEECRAVIEQRIRPFK